VCYNGERIDMKKNKGGRPKLFKSPEQMQEAIDLYFEECNNNTIEVYDKKQECIVQLKKPIPYTIEGLVCVLDIDRKTLLNYHNREEFFPTIKKAKQEILRNQVEAGITGVSDKTMTIFLLKNNHDYADKTEIKADVTQTVTEIKRTYE